MTRAEKKCMAFSVGMHTLLALIVIGGAAFQSSPAQPKMATLTMIPRNILDNVGVGGGTPDAEPPPPQPIAQPPPQPAPPQPQPVKPIVQPKPAPVAPPKPAEAKPRPVEPKPVERDLPEPVERGIIPAAKPAPKKQHEVQVDYTPTGSASKKRVKQKPTEDSAASAAQAASASARAEAKRQKAIRDALASLDTGLTAKSSSRPAEDTRGDGGESFANYGAVVQSIYDHSWVRPDNASNRLAETRVKVVVARDGTIVSAEIVNSSGDSVVDRSVERALRAVTQLPEFPAGTHDQQRFFYIRFNLTAKDSSG